MLFRSKGGVVIGGEGATPYAILIQRKFSNPNARTLLSALEPY